MITINSNTRQFNIPGADLVFGVVADSDAERKFFQCPRYVGDNLDLAGCFIRINYRNANGQTDFYLVDDMAIDGDNITFSWLLSPKVTRYRGQVKFVMCAVGPDLKLKWHTTQGTGQVMDGLEPDNSHVESQTADVVAQLIAMVEAQTSAVEVVGADQVAAVKVAAEAAQAAAVAEIEAKRANSLASIPNDYTSMGKDVDAMEREKAPGIVCSAESEVITLNDASDQAFRGFRIFGKSTQDGTPTPEKPVEIVSVGDGGSVGIRACGKNLLKNQYAGTATTRKGITFTHNKDGTITVNGTSVEREQVGFATLTLPAGSYILSQGYTGIAGKQPTLFATFFKDGETVWVDLTGDSAKTITLEEPTELSVVCDVRNAGQSYANFMVYPMIRLASVPDDTFEPYKNIQTLIARTPSGLPGIPVTSGGNYTDANGQQWVCDEIDLARGVHIHRIQEVSNLAPIVTSNANSVYQQTCSNEMLGKETPLSALCTHTNTYHYVANDTTHFYIDEKVVRVYLPTGTDVTGLKVYAILKTQVETPLSETELAAYRTLHTNKPNTTILNDSGAYMSVDYTADTKLYIDNKIKEALQ